MKTMPCDKCGQDVEPPNNAILYDAAFEALTALPTQSATLETPFTGLTRNTFAAGEIVPGDPRASIESILNKQNIRGRHFNATDTCEGSPSRRKNVTEGKWVNGAEMDAITAEAARRAYDLMHGLGSE